MFYQKYLQRVTFFCIKFSKENLDAKETLSEVSFDRIYSISVKIHLQIRIPGILMKKRYLRSPGNYILQY